MTPAARADLVAAAVLLALAAAAGLSVRAMPVPRFMDYGAGFFPGLLSVLLAVFAMLLGLRGATSRGDRAGAIRPTRAVVVAAALVFGGLAVFAIFARSLGFPLLIVLVAGVMLRAAGMGAGRAVALAAALAVAIHLVFAGLLRAPLPAGPLTALPGGLF